MIRTFPRKHDLVELMTTRLNIMEKHEDEWRFTQEFGDFIEKHTRDVTQVVMPLYLMMRQMNPDISEHLTSLLAMLLAWDNDIRQEDAIEAACFIDYWKEFGICPFDHYGSEPVGVV